MTAIEATNRGAVDMPWAMLDVSGSVPEVSAEELAAKRDKSLLIDVREPDEYAYGHITGAVNMPQARLATRLNSVPRDRPIVITCQAGMRSYRAAQFLQQVGFERISSLKGGTAGWKEAGLPTTQSDPDMEEPKIIESEWAHAGGYNFEI